MQLVILILWLSYGLSRTESHKNDYICSQSIYSGNINNLDIAKLGDKSLLNAVVKLQVAGIVTFEII